MIDFIKQADLISPISDNAKDDLFLCLKKKKFNKGESINQIGQTCRHLFFVEKGLIKHYYYHNENQFILRFFCDKRFVTISNCFLENVPAEYSTIAIEDTTMIYLEYVELEELRAKHHSIDRFVHTIISNMASMCISRLKTILHSNGTERYCNFVVEYGHLQQRISLGDTASFLGMSQVSLSRLRAKM